MSERYQFDTKDRVLLQAASVLLKKVATAETVRPAELVSIAKLQHVLSRLPKVTSGVDAKVSVISSPRNFNEIETFHWWEFAVEEERLSIASGGHFHRPTTGGDSFSTMHWVAIPGWPAELDDYSAALWMVPDIQSFPDGVASIDLASGTYKVEIYDQNNPLLEEHEETDEENSDNGTDEELDDGEEDDESGEGEDEPRAWSVTPMNPVETQLAAIVDPDEVAARNPRYAPANQNCDYCFCALDERGLFVDGRLRDDLMWGNMCADCFAIRGAGLGWGDGQLYARQPDGDWRMVAGWRAPDAGA